MRGEDKLTIFASGNGDTIMIEAHDRTIITDIHYRSGQADDDNDEVPDFLPDIRASCPDDHLHIFVLTHPDKDHLGGWSEIFHCGAPEAHDPSPEDDDPKIVVNEIWCTSYALDPHYVADQARPLIDEIKRRDRLKGTDSEHRDGNRLVVMNASTHSDGSVTDGLSWRILAPTEDEVNIPEASEDETPTSSNSTSLVFQWTINVSGYDNYFLLCGDSTLDVWERIEQEIYSSDPGQLSWHILVAPHHCSRHSIGRVENGNGTDNEFEESEEALRALGEQRGNGFVVSSSKRIVRGAQTPPSFHAKNRYLKILARNGEVTDTERERFLCTGGSADDEKPAHIV